VSIRRKEVKQDIYIYTLCKVEAYMCVWPLPVGTVKIYLDDELEKKTSGYQNKFKFVWKAGWA
jgi:hypothetical protein